ncbi:hypothetical protein P9139_06170 [Curtobacterium flaccumfaciens]|nr:hypothetical protein P9139_06170 [Curtobacterium flaccumfaciens]
MGGLDRDARTLRVTVEDCARNDVKRAISGAAGMSSSMSSTRYANASPCAACRATSVSAGFGQKLEPGPVAVVDRVHDRSGAACSELLQEGAHPLGDTLALRGGEVRKGDPHDAAEEHPQRAHGVERPVPLRERDAGVPVRDHLDESGLRQRAECFADRGA